MGLREWVRGRAGWAAVVALSGLAGAAYGLRQGPPPAAVAARAAAAEYVVPDGLVADANLDRGGTDNAAAIQAAVNRALRSNLPVRLPPGVYGVGSTLKVPNGVGFVLGGSGRAEGGPPDFARGTWLVWQGRAGGTLLDCRGMNYVLHDLGLASAGSTSLDRCVNLAKPPGPYPPIATGHLFENVAADGRRGPVRCGWVCGEDGSANGEFYHFRGCATRHCSYAGVSVPNATRQAKNWRFEHCSFGGSGKHRDYGVVWNSGSADFYHCNFDALGCGVAWFGGSFEPVTFAGCTGENNRRWCQATGVANLNLLGCRLHLGAALKPQPARQEFVSGGANWVISGCTFEADDALAGFLRPADGGSAVVQACQFHSAKPFPADDKTRFRLVAQGVRVSAGNNLLPEGGSYWQRNVPGLSYGGGGVLLSDGHWPPKGSYAGGAYTPGPGEARLYFEAGKLWLSVAGGPPKAVSVAP